MTRRKISPLAVAAAAAAIVDLSCGACRGTGGIDKWERVPLKPEYGGMSMNFREVCPVCRGTGLARTEGQSTNDRSGQGPT